MNPIPVNLAIEDELSETVLRRIIAHTGRGYAIGTAYGRGGFGYLKRTIHGWNRAAAGVPFVLLTDLDELECPMALIEDWLTVPRHANLIFRVAVREVEAWLLADGTNFSRFLRVQEGALPKDVEALKDPKACLIGLARKSRSREIRERIAPLPGSTAKQGRDYNACLVSFVVSTWSIPAAAARSVSLARAVRRLGLFKPVWAGSS
jgi:hypothetical protein